MFDSIFGFKLPWAVRSERREAERLIIAAMQRQDARTEEARRKEVRDRALQIIERRATADYLAEKQRYAYQRDAIREMQHARRRVDPPRAQVWLLPPVPEAMPRSQSGLSPRREDVMAPAWQNEGNNDSKADGNRSAVAAAPIGRGGSFDGGGASGDWSSSSSSCSGSSSDSSSDGGSCGGGD